MAKELVFGDSETLRNMILFFQVFLFAVLSCIIHTQKISGDVGAEDVPVVTENPFLINIPTINWDDILRNFNIPTIPPLQIPTLDPNFWQNLPTLAPIQIPTLDPNFWKNLNIPTIPPLVFPTLDPNFWQNIIQLPTLPPFQIPTLDPNFWKNLPTLPPFQLPTLDPNIFNFPTPTPRTAQCTYKLAQEIQNNSTFESSLNYTNVQSIIDNLLEKSISLCSGYQSQKLTDLSGKYQVLVADFQQAVPYLSTAQLKTILLGILNADSLQVSQIFFSKTMENLSNAEVVNKISKVSSQIGLLQLDLALSPI